MSGMKNFFDNLNQNDVKIQVSAKGITAQIDGGGVGVYVTANRIDEMANSIKKRANNLLEDSNYEQNKPMGYIDVSSY